VIDDIADLPCDARRGAPNVFITTRHVVDPADASEYQRRLLVLARNEQLTIKRVHRVVDEALEELERAAGALGSTVITRTYSYLDAMCRR